MNIKSLLIFAGGLVIGGAAGVFGSKKYFEDKYQKKYEEDHNTLEKYYQHIDEYSRSEKDEEDESDNEVNPIEAESRPGGRMSPEERAAVKEKLNRNWKETTNYAGMYKEKNRLSEDELAEMENPEEEAGEEIDEDEDDDINPLDEEAFDEHQKNKNRPPRLISAQAYSELPAYIDQEVLYFYTVNEVLCDENEDFVEEPERLVGDCLAKYDFAESKERVIFVMNYAIDTCYEIQKVDAAWDGFD